MTEKWICYIHVFKFWTLGFSPWHSDLGLHIQLGHPTGDSCSLPQQAFNDDFMLINTNGIHTIGLDFCGCATAQTKTKQLLRTGLFPATTIDPCTAATFRILEQYHLLSFESKASWYEFYHLIVHLTDNTGLHPQKDHYEPFLHMICEWRRGHDPAGVANTQSGECTVLCPVCPQPLKNLPDNWKDAPSDKRWLYALFVAIDANFCLKRHIVSKDATDPGLSHGWTYFVDKMAYKAYLQVHGSKPQEKSTCTSHNAVNMADTKASQGLAATGVGTIDCVQHNIKLPNGVGDLQKGERFFIPKFHLPAHIFKCQTMYSFNFSKNVGQTDGEAPECGCTKEMGPGSQRDTLDDHFGDWNWKKIIRLGTTLLRKIDKAQEEKEAYRMAFEELDGALQPRTSDPWRLEIEYWEHNPNDSSVTNPFRPKVTPRYQHISSPSVFVASGVDLENEQCRLKADVAQLGLHPTDTQKATIQHQRNSLQHKINVWRHIQALYIPAVQLLHLSLFQSSTDPITPEDTNLYLPSATCTRSMRCDTRLQTTKWELCYAQAGDALEELRQNLHLRDYMYTFKRDWVRGQGTNTRAQNALTQVLSKVSAAADKYCAAHGALSALAPLLKMVSWNLKYKELHRKDDICGMSAPTKGVSEGRRQLSWIWLVEEVRDDQDEVIQDSLRVE
ncbi:uncharacterized protein EDB93DRAFT_1239208 [Suillus bovinus]|uniref:uncharacterized protein n=1 Tax=Suillus bovinus TaxID=48563 RepID=UPI001B880AFE|nr:uncharacterized protein EDB93DRAFT_1239208 [Suillus bovinus]KAG2155314.1 hypothetical protein EDB93DRAFT_1239208 [Suillus bovinus]